MFIRRIVIALTVAVVSALASRPSHAQCGVAACITWQSSAPGWNGTFSTPNFTPARLEGVGYDTDRKRFAPEVTYSRGWERGEAAVDSLVPTPAPIRTEDVPPPPGAEPRGREIAEQNPPPPPVDPAATGRDRAPPPAPTIPICARQNPPTCSYAAGGVEVPRPTGREPTAPRTVDLAAAEGGERGSDPVSPESGEFVYTNEDLAFPGFGVPYRHVRTYRSRVDYDGPLGFGWDHSYNRTIVLQAEGSCGEAALYLGGDGRTIRFTRGADGAYTPPPGVFLRLDRTSSGWTLADPTGITATFADAGGVSTMTSLLDTNGQGLRLSWQPSARAERMRLASVTDSAGRVITYRYDGTGRLERVESTGHTVRYHYEGVELVGATDPRGIRESYEYDDDPPTEGGDYLPEGAAQLACQVACGPATACGGGGVCDDAATQRPACAEQCGRCTAACAGGCGAFCNTACAGAGTGAECRQACEARDCSPALVDRICQDAWVGRGRMGGGVPPRDYCDRCDEDILGGCGIFCTHFTACGTVAFTGGVAAGIFGGPLAGGTAWALGMLGCLKGLGYDVSLESLERIALVAPNGLAVIGWAVVDTGKCVVTGAGHYGCKFLGWITRRKVCSVKKRCDYQATKEAVSFYCNDGCYLCNAFGLGCGAGSCQAGRTCFGECSDAFFGADRPENSCSNSRGGTSGCPGRVRGACVARCAQGCSAGCQGQCGGTCTTACLGQCGSLGDEAQCRTRCETVDFVGECRRGCVEGCLAQNRARTGGLPRYGYPRDLAHNLTVVRDATGAAIVENRYGEDIEAPSFDAVIGQTNGGAALSFHYRDLQGEVAGVVTPPAVGPAAEHVDPPGAFERVTVCPWSCPSAPPGTPCTERIGPAVRQTGGYGAAVRATVLVDAYSVAWTYYFDGAGRVLRRRNGRTGATYDHQYDTRGNPIGIGRPLGDRECRLFDGNGNLIEQQVLPVPGGIAERKDEGGFPIPIVRRFVYRTWPDRLEVVFDPRDLGRQLARYRWDERGNFLGLRLGTGEEMTSVPDARGLAESETAFNGGVTRLTYDAASGTLSERVVGAGGPAPIRAALASDTAGRPTSATAPLGEVTLWAWSANRLQTVTRRAAGVPDEVETLTYDANGRVATRANGTRSVAIAYDGLGQIRRTAVTALDGTAAPAVACQSLGPDGRLLEQVLPEGHRVQYEYDGEGRLLTVTKGRWPAAAGAWDDDCPAPGAGEERHVVLRMTYDANGRLTSTTDGRGAVTRLTHDAYGREIGTRSPDGYYTYRGFDEMGNATWEGWFRAVATPEAQVPYPTTSPAADDANVGQLTAFAYDRVGRLESVTRNYRNAAGAAVGKGTFVTRFGYDLGAGTLTTIEDDEPAGATFTVISSIDEAGRPRGSRTSDGDDVLISYAEGGRVVTRSWNAPTPSGALGERLTYTPFGSLETVGLLEGGGVPAARPFHEVERWTYDRHRRPRTYTEAAGYETTFTYDALDRLRSETRTYAGGVAESLTYDWYANDLLRRRTSAAGQGTPTAVIDFTALDALERVTRVTGPGTLTETLTYAGATDLIETRTLADGTVRQFDYTPGRLLSSVSGQPPGAAAPAVRRFTYDPWGRLAGGERTGGGQPAIMTRFALDSLGQREREEVVGDPSSVVTHTYGFAGSGRPLTTTIADRTPLSLEHRARRLRAVYRDLGDGERDPLVSFTYAGQGGPVTRSFGNGVTGTFTYDTLGRLQAITERHGDGSELARLEWQLPLDGVPRASLSRSGERTRSSVFELDGGSRLLREAHGASEAIALGFAPTASAATANAAARMAASRAPAWRSYTLDGRHNWVSRDAADPALRATTERDARDAYTRFGDTVPQYNPRGETTAFGEERYQHGPLGELVSATVGGLEATYQYDFLGRVVASTSGGRDVTIAHDGPRRAAMTGSDGTILFVGGEDVDDVHAMIGSEFIAFLHQDRLRSVTLATGFEGEVLDRYEYTAYGERTVFDASGAPVPEALALSPFGFQGQRHDPAVGLVDMRHRWYRAPWGRFLEPDPIGLAGGANLYAFVGSAPLAWRDPWGLAPRPQQMGPQERALWLGAEQAGYSNASVQALLDFYSRPEFLGVQRGALGVGAVRATAAVRQWEQRHFVSSIWNYTMAVVDSFGSPLMGETRTETAGRVGAAIVVGGALNKFTSWAASTRPTYPPPTTNQNVVRIDATGPGPAVIEYGPQPLPANPRAYSTAYEFRLDRADFGRSERVHFNRANAGLEADLLANPEWAASMESMIPGITSAVSPVGGRQTPPGWIWHHETQPGVLRLVPSWQHTPSSPFHRVLHPAPGAAGGYSIWAVPAGAPPRR